MDQVAGAEAGGVQRAGEAPVVRPRAFGLEDRPGRDEHLGELRERRRVEPAERRLLVLALVGAPPCAAPAARPAPRSSRCRRDRSPARCRAIAPARARPRGAAGPAGPPAARRRAAPGRGSRADRNGSRWSPASLTLAILPIADRHDCMARRRSTRYSGCAGASTWLLSQDGVRRSLQSLPQARRSSWPGTGRASSGHRLGQARELGAVAAELVELAGVQRLPVQVEQRGQAVGKGAAERQRVLDQPAEIDVAVGGRPRRAAAASSRCQGSSAGVAASSRS